MGLLINKEKRLAAKDLRQERRSIILETARQSFMRFPFADVSLESIDKATGMRQGKAGLIFGSKEELFLELLAIEIAEWNKDFSSRLDQKIVGREALITVLVESVLPRQEFLRWMGLLHVVLAGNIEGGAVHVFMHGLQESLKQNGARLEAVAVPEGEGALRLVRFLLYAAATAAVCHPVGSFAIAMMQSDEAWSSLDLEDELRLIANQIV